jgi:hypothetical protein
VRVCVCVGGGGGGEGCDDRIAVGDGPEQQQQVLDSLTAPLDLGEQSKASTLLLTILTVFFSGV